MVGDPDLKADQVDMTVIDGHVVLIGVVSLSAKVKKIIAIAHATEVTKEGNWDLVGHAIPVFLPPGCLNLSQKKLK